MRRLLIPLVLVAPLVGCDVAQEVRAYVDGESGINPPPDSSPPKDGESGINPPPDSSPPKGG